MSGFMQPGFKGQIKFLLHLINGNYEVEDELNCGGLPPWLRRSSASELLLSSEVESTSLPESERPESVYLPALQHLC